MEEVEFILEKLERCGIHSGYFHKTTIGAVNKSSCPTSNVEVFDYDHCKEKFCSEKEFQEVRSCDAVKFFGKENKVHFIEMKRTEEFIRHTRVVDPNSQAEKKVNHFALVDKLRESFSLLIWLTRSKEFAFTKAELDMIYNVEFTYYVLVDSEMEDNSIEALAITLEFLSEASNNLREALIKQLKEKLSDIDEFKNVTSQLISCSMFSSIYA